MIEAIHRSLPLSYPIRQRIDEIVQTIVQLFRRIIDSFLSLFRRQKEVQIPRENHLPVHQSPEIAQVHVRTSSSFSIPENVPCQGEEWDLEFPSECASKENKSGYVRRDRLNRYHIYLSDNGGENWRHLIHTFPHYPTILFRGSEAWLLVDTTLYQMTDIFIRKSTLKLPDMPTGEVVVLELENEDYLIAERVYQPELRRDDVIRVLRLPKGKSALQMEKYVIPNQQQSLLSWFLWPTGEVCLIGEQAPGTRVLTDGQTEILLTKTSTSGCVSSISLDERKAQIAWVEGQQLCLGIFDRERIDISRRAVKGIITDVKCTHLIGTIEVNGREFSFFQ